MEVGQRQSPKSRSVVASLILVLVRELLPLERNLAAMRVIASRASGR